MNTERLKEWIEQRVCELVYDFHVPREEAESLMRYVRNGSIAAEAEARNEAQFLLDFKRLGSAVMAQRHSQTPQAMRKKRAKLLNRNRELRAELREA